jgi:hypothetical protein
MEDKKDIAYIMAMIAKYATEDFLIERLESAINDYKKLKLQGKSKQELNDASTMICYASTLFIMKTMNEDPAKLANRIDQIESFSNMFNPKIN